MLRLVILGRDGVINQAGDDLIDQVEAFQPIPGSLEAIARLNHAGIQVAVATHQPGLSSEQLTLDMLNRIHGRLQQLLSRVGGHVDGFFICPHPGNASCECRWPAPGLLLDISHRFGLPLRGIPVIGSCIEQTLAAHAVQARSISVGTPERFADTERFDTLDQAIDTLLKDSA